ncbi:hypothetical protein OGAPHI_000806 [Ogataea philodendri]|uniref:Uncharacterized protein n=1 Tax=Ogataea philodendri TaxID=1378263 RepID=A0A9P8PGF9_9ASCO|nr:uncharacterized protein OGAPHI_000806 [Ogataea philodendri]KAH3671095.1 hypothetical protein OGAPHI_000806 [Ogataea philodendri]
MNPTSASGGIRFMATMRFSFRDSSPSTSKQRSTTNTNTYGCWVAGGGKMYSMFSASGRVWKGISTSWGWNWLRVLQIGHDQVRVLRSGWQYGLRMALHARQTVGGPSNNKGVSVGLKGWYRHENGTT